MKTTTTLLAASLFGAGVAAFPRLPPSFFEDLAKRNSPLNGPLPVTSQAETNCGPTPCLEFNAQDQYVSTTGQYAWEAPATSDIRGPCPGLNAAANHGYLPRNGVASITQTITGLGALYNMSPDLAGFLAAYAVVLDGDVVTQTWSIGGPPPFVGEGVLTPPQGISYSHNKYEGDTSIGRNDAYLNNGDAYSLNVTRFGYAFATGQSDGTNRYTLDKFRIDSGVNQLRSIQNNPYYFAPLFSTTLVAPAAYNFVINFMSNHSAAEPGGYLNGAMFKEFFAVTGKYEANAEGSGFGFKWEPGLERVPNNWYRRPTSNQYNAADVIIDLAIGWAAYPSTFRFGGNTAGTNTYEGIELDALTGGTYNNTNILEPANIGCLLFQTQQQFIPDELKGGINAIAPSLRLIAKYSGFLKEVTCPALAKYDSSLFNKYPGHTYSPTAPCTSEGC